MIPLNPAPSSLGCSLLLDYTQLLSLVSPFWLHKLSSEKCFWLLNLGNLNRYTFLNTEWAIAMAFSFSYSLNVGVSPKPRRQSWCVFKLILEPRSSDSWYMMSLNSRELQFLGRRLKKFSNLLLRVCLLPSSLGEALSLWARSKCVAPTQGLPTMHWMKSALHLQFYSVLFSLLLSFHFLKEEFYSIYILQKNKNKITTFESC